MAKVKLNLIASPTFSCAVNIPVAGAQPIAVQFTCKHRTRDEYKTFLEDLKDQEDVALVMSIASGWDLEDAFTQDNVETMVQNHMGSALAILEAYMAECSGAKHRLKN